MDNPAKHYRQLADSTRRLSETAHQDDIRQAMKLLARDYEEIAEDIEDGIMAVRHPELLPQL